MMKKLTIIAATIMVAGVQNLFAYCVYADCSLTVSTSQSALEIKIAKSLNDTSSLVDDVAKKYNAHIDAVKEQNKVLQNLQTLTIKNNLLLRQIALESEKSSDLHTSAGNISAKKNESIQNMNESEAAVAKVQSEDSQ